MGTIDIEAKELRDRHANCQRGRRPCNHPKGCSRTMGLARGRLLLAVGGTLGTVLLAAILLTGAQAPEPEAKDAGHPGQAIPAGLQVSQSGYTLSPIDAPDVVAESGTMRFSILGPEGEPVTDFTEVQEKQLHLIVVTSDTSQFDHVHPEMDDEGVWSIDWEWRTAGAYKVFADFMPTDLAEELTLARLVEVSGGYEPEPLPALAKESQVGEYEVTLTGELSAGESSPITVRFERDGEPVTALEPYLGAYAHLVALRDGDLAYIHVHAEEAASGGTAGPEVSFHVETPTPGVYRLFLDFQVEDEVRTADFTLEATRRAPHEDAGEDGHGGHGGHEHH